ncbi:lycopene cyclase family protein [Psychroflexus sediminis]|uniref:Lycopene beta-cyclase n=1 Tax=Psychroflexus sediminis TaxID=470826 RepID=A0A1G7VTA7_9FLAO|nr:lycopene cyclase family protein [Psychroflexus sediminis]SDG62659.1 lycopene beta-cyclase [Psychroflexus sediminis]
MSTIKYDYIIVGAGAAGLNLALAMAADAFFEDKSILILDKDAKDKNDRTWSFWEKGTGNWDNIISKSWDKGLVKANGEYIPLNLKKYRYKTLRSADFYDHAKKTLPEPNFTWKTEQVQKIMQADEAAVVITDQQKYKANLVFDSRVPMSYSIKDDSYLNIAQHFKGWIIETEKPVFDDSMFTMMDFDLKDGESTSFTYILPFSPNRALVEFTYFSPDVVEESTYDDYLKKYISEHLQTDSYTILETEKGIIPMTNFPFEDYNQKHIIKIGTAGGWVKASSGYSFKNCERKSQNIIKFLKSKQEFYKDSTPVKYKHYDKIFLEVLTKENHFGEELFYRMYKNNSIQTIFRFLDEKSSFQEDLKIIMNLSSSPFIKGFMRHLKSGFNT